MVKAQAGILDSDTAHEAEGKLQATVADLIHDPAEAAWVEEHAARRWPGSRRDRQRTTATARRWPPGAGSWRRWPTVVRWCWSSRTCTGPTTALLDFIDHLADWSSDVPMLVVCTARPELLDRRARLGRRQAKRAHGGAVSSGRLGHRETDRHPAGAGAAAGRDPGRCCSGRPRGTRSTPRSTCAC